MNEDERQLMTKKEKKKEEKRLAKSYIKAQYNYRIGYIFKTIKEFLKQYLIYYLKKYIKFVMFILLIISLVFIIFGSIKMINGNAMDNDIDKYKEENKALQSKSLDLKSDLKKENEKIESASISTQSGVKRSKETIDKVFKGMYDYSDYKEYAYNRKVNMDYFKNSEDKWIDSIYSNDKDVDGNSQIKTLGLTSTLDSADIFTESVEDTSKKIVPFKVVVSYTGYIDAVSSEYATRTHYTTYEVNVDTKDNKITHMKKLNTVKINDEIS